MLLFTQIQLYDHPSVFGIAEHFIAITAELSVCLCHIAAQRLLEFLWDAAPQDHIAPAGVPHIHDAGPVAVLLRKNQLHPYRRSTVFHPICRRCRCSLCYRFRRRRCVPLLFGLRCVCGFRGGFCGFRGIASCTGIVGRPELVSGAAVVPSAGGYDFTPA